MTAAMTAALITTEQQAIITNLLRFAAAVGASHFESSCCGISGEDLQPLMEELGITKIESADKDNPEHASTMADYDMMNGDDIHILQTNKMAELLAPLLVSCNKPTQQKEEHHD